MALKDYLTLFEYQILFFNQVLPSPTFFSEYWRYLWSLFRAIDDFTLPDITDAPSSPGSSTSSATSQATESLLISTFVPNPYALVPLRFFFFSVVLPSPAAFFLDTLFPRFLPIAFKVRVDYFYTGLPCLLPLVTIGPFWELPAVSLLEVSGFAS